MDDEDDFYWFSQTFLVGKIAACTIGWTGGDRGFQVSVRRDGGDGWEVYYGEDLKDACRRAVTGGPQMPQGDDDFGGLV